MKKDIFAMVPIVAVRDHRLRVSDLRVLIALLSFKNKREAYAYPKRSVLGERAGYTSNNISKITNQLVRLGWLEKIGKGGRGEPIQYKILIPKTLSESASVLGAKTVTTTGTVYVGETLSESASVKTLSESATVSKKTLSKSATIRDAVQTTKPTPKRRHANRTDQEQTMEQTIGRTPPQKGASSPTWDRYSDAYESRYGIKPVRNGRINGQLTQMIKRIGLEESPSVAEYFVTHNNRYYCQRGHSVDCLLRDCEKLRMEFHTQTQITESDSRKKDSTQGRVNVFQNIMNKNDNEKLT